MSESELFSMRLKELRGKKSVKELAEENGVSQTLLYKAEDGKSVMWKSIEAAYGPLCRNHDDYQTLLMMWALTQSERTVGLYLAKEAMIAAVRENADGFQKESSEVLDDMKMLEGEDLRLFVKFSKSFRRSPHTRALAKAWLESQEGKS